MKHIIAAALVAPFLVVSATAQDTPRLSTHVYQGGPGSTIPHATKQVTTWEQAFAMAPKAKGKATHAYRGGPQTVVPHGY